MIDNQESVLVIGGTGPTGPTVVKGLLERGVQPVVLHRGTHESHGSTDAVEHIHADPHFAESLTEAVEGRSFTTVIAMYGRLKIVADVFAGRADRLISVGGGMYVPSSVPADEDAPRWTNGALYERIVETEAYLLSAHRSQKFAWTHLRYPAIYGPRQLVPRELSVIRRIQAGRRVFPLPDGGLTLYSRAYAVNAGRAVLAAFDNEANASGQVFNVADSVSFSIADWIRTVALVLESEISIVSIPAPAAASLAFWLSGRARRELSRSAGVVDTQHELFDTGKFDAMLGKQVETEFRTTIEATVQWLVSNPPADGSSINRNLGDPLDYADENRLIEEFGRRSNAENVVPTFLHAYDHPKTSQG